MAGYMNYDHPLIYFQKAFVYICVVFAIWLGAQPWRMRDFSSGCSRRPQRTRAVGGTLAAYGLLLALIAFTY